MSKKQDDEVLLSKEDIAVLDTELAKQTRAYKAFEKASTLVSMVKSLNQAYGEVSGRINVLKEQEAELKGKVSALASKHEQDIVEAKEQAAQIVRDGEAEAERLIQEANAALEARNAEVEKAWKEIDTHLEEKKKDLEDLQGQIDVLTAQKAGIEKFIADQKKNMTAAQAALGLNSNEGKNGNL